jgi:hypothetical protein
MKDELIELLSSHKIKRFADEKLIIVQARYSNFALAYESIVNTKDLREPFPALGDVLTHKPLENIIWDTPIDERLDDAQIQSKLSDEFLPAIIANWRPAKVQEMVTIMQKSQPVSFPLRPADTPVCNSESVCSEHWMTSVSSGEQGRQGTGRKQTWLKSFWRVFSRYRMLTFINALPEHLDEGSNNRTVRS